MPTDQPVGAGSSAADDVAEIERALTRIAHLITRARRHDHVKAATGVPLDRAAVIILRMLSESDALRPSELAARLQVEAPHVTRQLQRLQKAGYVSRVVDPGDRRAQLVQVTPAGRQAAVRIREVAAAAMRDALADWSPQELHQLAGQFHRMVDDFLAYVAEEER
ncbi:MarR family transcriptional regulator [Streptomyces sp. NBC_01537]|uniref:MarR family winged helix-turn-helix transcriptional regulator n=1 Tax=Streptomyces sp. NBC_01537 TaxID=2903896 RepID=UPI003863DD35